MFFGKLLIFILLMFELTFEGNSSSSPDQLIFAFEIIESYFPVLENIAVFSNNETYREIKSYFYRRNLAVTLLQWNNKKLGVHKNFQIVILLLSEVSEVQEVLSVIPPFWDYETVFFIVPGESAFEEPEEKIRIFKKFWGARNTNVVLISSSDSALYSHGFEIYVPGSCNELKPILFSEKVNGTITQYSWFKRSSYMNFHGCDITISYMDFPPNIISQHQPVQRRHLAGLEGEMIRTFSEVLNFTPWYKSRQEVNWGGFVPPSGLLGDLFTGSSELGVGLLFPFVERYNYLDVAVPHNADACLGWIVPKSAGASRSIWFRLYVEEFTLKVWGAVFLTFFLTLLYFEIIHRPKKSIFMDLFSSLLGLPILDVPTSINRCVLLIWFLYGYVITTAYKSSMSSRLTAPNAPSDIQNLVELVHSKLRLTGPFNALKVLEMAAKTEVGNTQKLIVNKFEVKNWSLNDVLKRMVSHRDIAFIRHTSTFVYTSMKNPKARGKVHVIDECFYQYYPWTLLKKVSYLTPSVNRIIQGLNEGGIFQKWQKSILGQFKEKYIEPPGPLDVNKMAAIFCLLMLGWSFATLAFVFEISVNYIKTRKPRLKTKPMENDIGVNALKSFR